MATLSIGCTFSDRIEALLDGRVRIAGQEAASHIVEPQRLFRAVLRDAAYDVAELSMASHVAAVAAGRRDYVGVPVFLSRSFRHANLYVRTDRGIDRPEDLAGRTIGLVDWQQTAALSLRGLLAHEHGVARESVRWVAAGVHAPVLDDRAAMTQPAGIRLERSSSTLDALLAEGTIDAVISPGAPRCFLHQTAPVAGLWHDPHADGRQARTRRCALHRLRSGTSARRRRSGLARFPEGHAFMADRSRGHDARPIGLRPVNLWVRNQFPRCGDDASRCEKR